MSRIEITSKDQWLAARSKNINSTEVSVLYGISKYTSFFEMWHGKKDGTYVEIEETERMMIGSKIESAIAHIAAEKMGWQIRPRKFYEQMDELRLGASYDFEIIDDTGTAIALLECKNVDSLVFKNEWEVDEAGNIESTPYIEVQCQTQMLVSGIKKLYICALVGGNSIKIIERDPDLEIQESIIKKVSEFWRSIEENKPPQPDFEKDYEFIRRLNSYAEPGTVIEPNDRMIDLAQKYKLLSDKIKLAESQRDGIKAELLMMIGDAEKVKGDTFSISAGIIGEAQVSYTRKAYRDFRLFFKKIKEDK